MDKIDYLREKERIVKITATNKIIFKGDSVMINTRLSTDSYAFTL